MTLAFTHFEIELEKIANWKVRAAEAALGAAPGAAIGYGMAKGEGASGDIERQAALAGGILGAGAGLGGSAVIRALKSMTEVESAVPKAVKAGKEALKKPTEEHERALSALKARGWHEKPPHEAHPVDWRDLAAAQRALSDAQNLRGPIAHKTLAIREANDLLEQLNRQHKAAPDWHAFQPMDEALKKAKAALDAALKEHGEKGVRQSTTDKVYAKHDKKLFGLL